MPEINTTIAPNGLPLHRVSIAGTRALTALVAFDAGARSEQPQENGVAHFLEHLVFKGGEATRPTATSTRRPSGWARRSTPTRATTSSRFTSPAEPRRRRQAIDLLSDIAGRPRLDADELDRERGVVIQEIARADDQPAMVAGHLIDRAAFGDHPLGRPVLGPQEHLRGFSREAIVAFRERCWSASRGAAFLVGNTDRLPDDDALHELFGRFPSLPAPPPYEPAPDFQPGTLVEARETNQSHLRMVYRPSIDPRDARQRAALGIYATLLGGSMGSRLFDEIREQRGLCYSVWAHDHSFADAPILALGSGLDSSKCPEAYARMREIVDELRRNGPREEEVERARAYAAGRLVLAFENSGAVARHGAHQAIVHNDQIDPDAAIAAVDGVTFDEVVDVARGISERLAVACVGPHAAADF